MSRFFFIAVQVYRIGNNCIGQHGIILKSRHKQQISVLHILHSLAELLDLFGEYGGGTGRQ